MTSKSLSRFGRTAIGAIATVVLVGSLAACTASDDEAPEADTPEVTTSEPTVEEDEGTPYVPEATDNGTAVISAISDCAQIGENLGSLLEGLELTLESVDSAMVFCDWGGDSPETPTVSVEIVGDGSVTVPEASVVEASGGKVIESPGTEARGGIVYALPAASGLAFALMAVLPEVSVSATAVGLEIGEEQINQLANAVENILTPAGE